MRRSGFLTALGTAPLALSATGNALALQRTLTADDRLPGALVLSGGGARGSYEAGIIAALVAQHGLRDGERIPGIDVVCGASIGALNGWMVASGQYSRLEQIWKTIGQTPLFQLKHQYAAIPNPESGVGTRVGEALTLFHGLVTDERGIMDSGPIKQWIDSEVDPATPLLVPLVFTVTNLTSGLSELFLRPPSVALTTPAEREEVAFELRNLTAGSIARVATDDIIRDAIRASAALPIFLDPVTLEGPNGPEDYVDGGVANNSPVDVARGLAKTVYTIFLDPRHPKPAKSPNAVAVGVASLGVAQHRLIEVALRSAYVETNLKRSLLTAGGEYGDMLNDVFDADLFVIHPSEELPIAVSDFTDQAKLDSAFALGYQRGLQGWAKYSPSYD